jgi:phenylalanyl-tRNA synthetase beta chain
MIISLNWLKKYVDIDIPTDELVALIGARLVEVEETVNLAEKYKDCVIVKVEKCERMEKSDHLSLCQVDVGDGGDLVQIVCGANNVHAGMLAVWLPPKSVVPETYGTGEPFALEARKLCGHISNGMLASVRELGLGENHDGIVEITGTDLHPHLGLSDHFFGTKEGKPIKPGDSFAKLFELDDTLFNIENKSLTHRPDCFGVIGFAREVSGILGKKFEEPGWLNLDTKLPDTTKSGLATPTVKIDDAELCPRYECVVLTDIDHLGTTSGTTQTYLMRSGMRPISASVDITNMIMLESGQPLHAFDYDKLVKVSPTGKPDIYVRAARQGEKMLLLDGKEIELAPEDIVVCAGDAKKSVPIALAGAMGGAATEIDDNTRNVLLESATFNLYNLRGTQFRHGIFSEAITRFTKGQPPALTEPALIMAARQFAKFTNANIASQIVDAYPQKITNQPIEVSLDAINDLLGAKFTITQAKTTLENVGFTVSLNDHNLQVTAPWWRTDIHIKEDIIEEVGRLNGFDNIPVALPMRQFKSITPDAMGDLKAKIRQILADSGANEVLTYSFVSEKLLEKAGQDLDNSYKIINSISPELQYIRQQIVPSLLEKAYENLRAGYDKFALFEINQVFWKKDGLDDEKVPKQYDNLGCVFIDVNQKDTNYYLAKRYVDELAAKLGVEIKIKPRTEPFDVEKYFEPKRSVDLFISDKYVGNIAEIKNSVLTKFKLPRGIAAIEMGVDLILDAMGDTPDKRMGEISKFPSVERDLTLRVISTINYADVENLLCQTLQSQNLQFQLFPISIYQNPADPTTKNISFRLKFASLQKTLSGDEIAKIMDEIAALAKRELKAEVI